MATAGAIYVHARSGLETTRGTAAPPDAKVIFDAGAHVQSIDTVYPTRLSGSFENHYDATAGTETNELNFSGLVDYNQMSRWGNLFFKALAAGTGAGADKTWAFLPTQTVDDLKSATIQFGVVDTLSATQPGWSIPYCVGEEFTLGYAKGAGTPGITFSAKLTSPKAATQISAYTGAAVEPTLQLASHINTAVTIDATTLGATVDNYVTGIDFSLQNNWANLMTLNNTAVAQDTVRPNARSWSATITRYYANDTELDAYVAKTPRKVRIRTLGAVLGSSFYKIDLELYGVYTARSWTDVDGMRMEQFTLSPRYDSTAGTSVNLNLVNAATAA